MQLEVGMVLEGKVTGITKFGAFIELPGGKTGMVHISEVAPTFVKEIRDFVTENGQGQGAQHQRRRQGQPFHEKSHGSGSAPPAAQFRSRSFCKPRTARFL